MRRSNKIQTKLQKTEEPKEERPKRSKRKRETKKEPENDENDQIFQVEVIITEKMIGNVQYFLVKWEHYGMKDNTWEPKSSFFGKNLALDQYAKSISEDSIKLSKMMKEKINSLKGLYIPEFTPKQILNQRKYKNNLEYFVKYEEMELNLWEPEENLPETLIKSYQNQKEEKQNQKVTEKPRNPKDKVQVTYEHSEKMYGYTKYPQTFEISAIKISKVINLKEVNGKQKVLMLPEESSYLHCFFVDKEIVDSIPEKQRQIYYLLNKGLPDFEYFDPDFLAIQRIIKLENSEYLIKWKLGEYSDISFEKLENISQLPTFQSKLQEFKNRLNLKNIPEKNIPNFQKFNESPVYKNEFKLKDYQIEGFNWILENYLNGKSIILGDEMGLGKTIQEIAVMNELVTKYQNFGPFLIIAPLGMLNQWRSEIETWTNLNCIVYHGSEQSKAFIEKYEISENNYSIIITNYENISDTIFQKIQFKLCIIDEAHKIKGRNSNMFKNLKKINVKIYHCLTGTPIQNNMDELFTLLHLMNPQAFPNYKEFSRTFPFENRTTIQMMQEQLKPYFLRRVKEDVEKTLPFKQEKIIDVELTKEQKRYYKAILEKNRGVLNKKQNLLNLFMQIRKVCNHPFLIKGVEETLIIENNLKNQGDINKLMISCSSKLSYLDSLLEQLPKNEKVLIFSQFLELLTILEDYLNYKNYNYERLDGQISLDKKQMAIDNFNKEDNCNIMLLSTKAGLGINLTAANHVVIFDSDFNPQNDLQAMSRSHRIGQTKDVTIYRILTRHTYEKKLMEIASKKLGLTKAILTNIKQSEFSEEENLSNEDIDKLLREGAYHIFLDDIKDDELIDLTEHIVDENQEKAQVIKSSFKVGEEDHKIDMNDSKFWEKVLPDYISVDIVKQKLHSPDTFSNEENKTQFIEMMNNLIEEYDNDNIEQVEEIWKLIVDIENTQQIPKEICDEWEKGMTKGRTRKSYKNLIEFLSEGESDEEDSEKDSEEEEEFVVEKEEEEEELVVDNIEEEDVIETPEPKKKKKRTRVPRPMNMELLELEILKQYIEESLKK